MDDHYRRGPNAKMIKLEKHEEELEDSCKYQPPLHTTSQNSIKLEQKPDLVSGYDRRPCDETRLLNPFCSININLGLNSNNPHIYEQKLTGFNCHKCLLHFATPGEMTRHWTERHGLHPVHCPVCNDPFANNIDLWHHTMDIHGIPCELCDDFFKTQEMLEAHMKSVHSDGSSSGFNQVFKVKEERMINDSDNQDIKPSVSHSLYRTFPEVQSTSFVGFKCHKCPIYFQTADLLKCHWLGKHGLHPAYCSVCKEIFPTMDEMLIHKAAHGIPCKFCNKEFDTELIMKRHIKSCHVNTCPICGMGFRTTILLKEHVNNCNDEWISTKQCYSCSSVAMSEEEFKVHLGTHTFPYKCLGCGIGFDSIKSFNKHMKRHIGPINVKASDLIPPGNRYWKPQTFREDLSDDDREPGMSLDSPTSKISAKGLELTSSTSHSEGSTTIPITDFHNKSLATFRCHLCLGVLGAAGALRDHWFNFHKLRPALCTICKKPYPCRAQMHVHKMAIHGGISCDICNRTFLKYISFEDHMKGVHGTTKEYSCSICDMRFSREIDLRKHVVSLHPDVAIKRCDICSFTCTTDDEMVKHKGNHMTRSCSTCGIVVNSNKALKRHRGETGHYPGPWGVKNKWFRI